MEEAYTLNQLADRLGVSIRMLVKQTIPQPALYLDEKVWWSESQMRAIQLGRPQPVTLTKVYTLQQVADECGLGIEAMAHRQWMMPEAAYVAGTRYLWTAEQVKQTKLAVIANPIKRACTLHGSKNGLYSLQAVVAQSGVPYHFALRHRGKLPAPTVKMGQKMYYSEDDLPKMFEALKALAGVPRQYIVEENTSGLYNKRETVEWLNMPLITFTTWLNTGKVPKPTHINSKKVLCYTEDELRAIKKTKAKYFKKRGNE